MKLYATTTNDKGKIEGVGSNDWLKIELNRGNKREYTITYDNEGLLITNNITRKEVDIITKGEKKKDDSVLMCDWCRIRPATRKDWREIDGMTTSTRECDVCLTRETHYLIKKYDK